MNATRIPIERKESGRWLDNLKQATTRLGDPARCVHIGDREADIYELFGAAQEAETHFLVRTCVDRLAGEGKTTVAKKMAREPIRGSHEVEVRDDPSPDGVVQGKIVATLLRVGKFNSRSRRGSRWRSSGKVGLTRSTRLCPES